jgi:hypothetical protein
VSYLRAHNFDAVEQPCIRALGVLKVHVLKSRSGEAGVQGAGELGLEGLDRYVEQEGTPFVPGASKQLV